MAGPTRQNPDPVLAEIADIKDRLASVFEYDVESILRDAKEREGNSGHRVIVHPKRKPYSL